MGHLDRRQAFELDDIEWHIDLSASCGHETVFSLELRRQTALHENSNSLGQKDRPSRSSRHHETVRISLPISTQMPLTRRDPHTGRYTVAGESAVGGYGEQDIGRERVRVVMARVEDAGVLDSPMHQKSL